jgi:hypothetical protein
MYNCRHCRRFVVLVRDAVLSTFTVMATHLRQSHPQAQLWDGLTRDAILSHFMMMLDFKPPSGA